MELTEFPLQVKSMWKESGKFLMKLKPKSVARVSQKLNAKLYSAELHLENIQTVLVEDTQEFDHLLDALSKLIHSNDSSFSRTRRTTSSEITASEIESLLTDFMKTDVL
jgi:hypothetical protein